jgi:ABC-2 type transport system ATP-binding protein
MSAAIRTEQLGKRYGSTWALRECTLEIPAGSVTALVGPNGAGKTTLLQLAIGLVRPTAGEVSVLDSVPVADAATLLPRVGFVAQDHEEAARARLARLGIPLDRKVGKLSGGQQAQVALTVALAKCPELLILDEPVASLDPLARREFMNTVMEVVSERQLTVVLSSHIVADLERVCDHLVILSHARTLVAAPIDEVLAGHRLLTGPRADATSVARVHEVIRESHTERQTSLLVRANGHVYDASWQVHEVDLEEIVLAYLGYGAPIELREAVAS